MVISIVMSVITRGELGVHCGYILCSHLRREFLSLTQVPTRAWTFPPGRRNPSVDSWGSSPGDTSGVGPPFSIAFSQSVNTTIISVWLRQITKVGWGYKPTNIYKHNVWGPTGPIGHSATSAGSLSVLNPDLSICHWSQVKVVQKLHETWFENWNNTEWIFLA